MSTIVLSGVLMNDYPPLTLSLQPSYVSGGLNPTGLYNYSISYISRFGETLSSTTVSITLSGQTSVKVSNIPVWPNSNCIGRRLYRSGANLQNLLLLCTINDNITTSYLDNTADSSLSNLSITGVNTAHSLQVLKGYIQLTTPLIHTYTGSITAHAGGGYTGATALTAEYNVITTCANTNDSVILPPINSLYIGLHMRINNKTGKSVGVWAQPNPYNQINNLGGSPYILAANTAIDVIVADSANWDIV